MRGATFLALRCSRKARSTAPQQLSHIVGMALALSILPGPTSFSSISHESTPTAPAVRPTILASAAASWKVVLTGGMHPPGRYAAAMAYDPLDGYVVLFGGVHVGVFLGDTWTFHTGNWTRLFIPHPPNRSGASMVYDAAAGCLLLFGGLNYTQALNDTWKFVHGRWTKLFPAHSPPARTLAVAAYDPRNRSVLVGGGWNIVRNLTDMWEFHGGKWSQVPVVPLAPFHGRYSSMAYDARDHYVTYFGDAGGWGNDTWNYSAGNWTQLSPPLSPPPMFWMNLAFDPQLRELVVFGNGNTWGFHGGHWHNLNPVTQPSARLAAAMTYDAADGYLLLFGGFSPSAAPPLHDTWRLV